MYQHGMHCHFNKVAQYIISYFPLRGRAEATRFLLADQGCEWEEDVVSLEDWMQGKIELQKEAVFGQIPRFTDGDFSLYQSNAILRYLGRKHDLYGTNNKEAALIDMANDGVEDLRRKMLQLMTFDLDTGKEKYVEDLPSHLRPFECLLSKNPSGFLIGSTVSFADFNLLDVLHVHLVLAPDCLKEFPHLTAFKKKMEARPKLKTYLASEEHKSHVIHPYRDL